MPFFEPGLPELLEKALATGRLSFTTDPALAAASADVHFVCVGTPQRKDSLAADLAYVDASVSALAPHLDRRSLIVGKSTVPIGTAARLTALVHRLAPAGEEVELAWNPEFLREGFAVEDTLRPDRLVFGVASQWALGRLEDVFAPVIETGVPVVTTDLQTAELVKVAANLFATKISYINAMAEVCEATGADVHHLAESLSYDQRIGGRFLRPGLGFGGGCLPKDIRAFMHRTEELGVGQATAFLREVDAINTRRRQRTVDLVRRWPGVTWREPGARSARPSSRTPTTSGTHPPSMWPRCCRPLAPTSGSTTRRRWRTRGGRTRSCATPARSPRPLSARTWSSC